MSETQPTAGRSLWFSARDGLRLHARVFEAVGSHRPPVLCLAGLTRNSRDFQDLAIALSSGPSARSVYALDCRGRGLSERDPDWKNYSIPSEMQDTIDLATIAGLHGATIIGTSRGGLITMLLAAAMPAIIGAVVLNDIGPVIERDGLARISGYAGRLPLPPTWAEAGLLVADMSKRQFPGVPASQWGEVARAWFNEKDGRPAPGYDPAIAKSVTAAGTNVPELWPQFEALTNVPLLTIRGENSDILSRATLEKMQQTHPNCAVLTVAGQGHAPLLKDRPTLAAIAAFAVAVEAGEAVGGRSFATA